MVRLRGNLERLMIPGIMSLGGDDVSGPILIIDKDGYRARISSFGGQILEWQPSGHEPVLWLSEGTTLDQKRGIRGGIPVCWPWFAQRRQNPNWPSHGFARTTAWPCESAEESDTGITLQLALPIADAHTTYWPYASRPTITYHLGEILGIELTMTNIDPHPIEWSQALHTYFHVGEIRAVSICGLESASFIDKLLGTDVEQSADNRPITISAEFDRIYRNLDGPISLRDAKLGRTITIEHAGASNAIVWNPWIEKSARLGDMGRSGAYRGMVCIETGNVAPDTLKLEPGETHTLETKISVRKEA